QQSFLPWYGIGILPKFRSGCQTSTFLPCNRVRIPEKNTSWIEVSRPLGVCSWGRRFNETAIQPRRSRNMSEPAVITPSTFTVARPQAGEYAPYYERYISLIQGEDILDTLDQ